MPPNDIQLELRPLKPGDSIAGLLVGDSEFQPLFDFFVASAHIFETNGLARTYVMTTPGDSRVYAYMTLVCGEMKLTGVDGLLGDGVQYSYRSAPALKLARLLVDATLRRRKIGSHLVDFALGLAKSKICPTAGCRFLVLDAKQASIEFYKAQGFTMLDTKQNKSRHQPIMFIDLHKAAA